MSEHATADNRISARVRLDARPERRKYAAFRFPHSSGYNDSRDTPDIPVVDHPVRLVN
jgi:hypothetical protein